VILRLIGRRLLVAVPVAIGASFLSFFLVNLLPGTVVLQILGVGASSQAIATLNAQLGFNKPLLVRYADWLGHAIRGQLGTSLTWHQTVTSLIASRFPVTAELVFLAILLALIPSVLLACFAALRPRGKTDKVLSVVSIFGLSAPNFLLALAFIYIFAVDLHWLPPLGFVPLASNFVQNLRSLVLPSLSIAAGLFAAYTRVLKADMIEQVSNEEYVNTARTKGTSDWRIVIRHVLRNSVFSLVTIVALNFGVLLGSTVIIEQVFALPGIGQLLVSAISERDQPVVEGVVLCLAVAIILMNLLADIAYSILDPRVRHGAR
jgi:peptide/nickel transport system permease protein